MKAESGKRKAESDLTKRIMHLLNLELVRDQEQVAQVISSGPAAEHHASAIPTATPHNNDPAAGPTISAGGHPVPNASIGEGIQSSPLPAVCAAGPAGSFSNN